MTGRTSHSNDLAEPVAASMTRAILAAPPYENTERLLSAAGFSAAEIALWQEEASLHAAIVMIGRSYGLNLEAAA
jgi:hypothetical protein